MDYQTKQELYERLNLAFDLDKEVSLINLYNLEMNLGKKDSVKIADDFKELCSILEKGITNVDHFSFVDDKRKEKDVEKLWDEVFENIEPQEEKETQEDNNSEIELLTDIGDLGKYKPIAQRNSTYYQILYLKTLMKYVVKLNKFAATKLSSFVNEQNIDYRLIPLYRLFICLYGLGEDIQTDKGNLRAVQQIIRDLVKNIVDNVMKKGESITNEVLEAFQIYTQIMLYIFMQEQDRITLVENDIPYVYMNAAVWGLLYDRTADVDNKSKDRARIYADAYAKERDNCLFLFRLVMLLEKKTNASQEERIDRAFRYDSQPEKAEQLKACLDLFHSYVRGGIEVMYEKLTEGCSTREDYLTRVYEIMKQFKQELDGTFYQEGLEDILDI